MTRFHLFPESPAAILYADFFYVWIENNEFITFACIDFY